MGKTENQDLQQGITVNLQSGNIDHFKYELDPCT